MSDRPVGSMTHEEEAAALRKDLHDVTAEANRAGAAASRSAADLAAEKKRHADAEAEIARLQQAARDASMPDAEIRAGWLALREKIASIFHH